MIRKAMIVILVSFLCCNLSCKQKQVDRTKEKQFENTQEKNAESTLDGRIVANPYQEVWDSADHQSITRFYLDINQDKIPELFLSDQFGSSSSSY